MIIALSKCQFLTVYEKEMGYLTKLLFIIYFLSYHVFHIRPLLKDTLQQFMKTARLRVRRAAKNSSKNLYFSVIFSAP